MINKFLIKYNILFNHNHNVLRLCDYFNLSNYKELNCLTPPPQYLVNYNKINRDINFKDIFNNEIMSFERKMMLIVLLVNDFMKIEVIDLASIYLIRFKRSPLNV